MPFQIVFSLDLGVNSKVFEKSELYSVIFLFCCFQMSHKFATINFLNFVNWNSITKKTKTQKSSQEICHVTKSQQISQCVVHIPTRLPWIYVCSKKDEDQ